MKDTYEIKDQKGETRFLVVKTGDYFLDGHDIEQISDLLIPTADNIELLSRLERSLNDLAQKAEFLYSQLRVGILDEISKRAKKFSKDLTEMFKGEAKAKIKEIEFGYSEHDVVERGKKFTTMALTNDYLFEASKEAPTDGSYLKIDYIVRFTDGKEWKGRYDLVHYTIQTPDLKSTIENEIRFNAGLLKPSSITSDQYEAYLKSIKNKEALKEFLETHDFS